MMIAIRTDASVAIGTGHVMRCLTLADQLRSRDAEINFICQDVPGHLIPFIEAKGYPVHRLPGGLGAEQDAIQSATILEKLRCRQDWVIVDHYGLDAAWETRLRPAAENIMVIDDLANRRHACELLLDQNYGEVSRYDSLVSGHCRKLLGPAYALLRPQFLNARESVGERTGEVRRILVFMGGSDRCNDTCKALQALVKLGRTDIFVDVVIGSLSAYQSEIESLASGMRQVRCLTNVEDMAELMAEADFSIGAGGTTTWERCALGLPSLVIAIAENQISISQELSKNGYIFYAGWHKEVTVEHLTEDIRVLLRYPGVVRLSSMKARELVDAHGTARVANHLMAGSTNVRFRFARPEDSNMIFAWRNHPEVRKRSFDTAPISREQHEHWLSNVLSSQTIALLIAEKSEEAIGVLKYDFKQEEAVVSVYLSPQVMGRGLGTHVIRAGNDWIKVNHPEIRRIIAEIRPENISSVHAFAKAGFRESRCISIYDVVGVGRKEPTE